MSYNYDWMRNSKRNKTLRRIIAEIRKEPKTVAKLVDELHLTRQTTYHNIDVLRAIDVLKKLPDGRIAWRDYVSEDEIEKAIKEFKMENWCDPSISQVAAEVGTAPDDEEFKKGFWKAAKRTGLNVSINMVAGLIKPAFVALKSVPTEILGKRYKHNFDVMYQSSLQSSPTRGRVAVRVFSTLSERAVQKAAGELLDIQEGELDGFIAAMIQTAGDTQRTFHDLRGFLTVVGERLHIPTEVVLVKKQSLDAVVKDVQHIAGTMLEGKKPKTSRESRHNLNVSKERREREEKVNQVTMKELGMKVEHSILEDMFAKPNKK